MINRNNKKLVDEYLAFRSTRHKLNHKSIRLEKSVSVHYLTWSAENDFSQAPRLEPNFMDYVERLECSAHYKRKLISSAKIFFEWLSIHKRGFHSITPAWLRLFRFKMYPEEFDDQDTISEEEVAVISKFPAETLLEKRVRAGACFLYISGMRVSAFTTMPIKAVDLQNLDVRQSPGLGMITKNKKAATTYLLDIEKVMRVVREWDDFVRATLPSDGYWFAPLSPKTGEIDPNPAKANENRSNLFRKNLHEWLKKNQSGYHSPHDFRRGHANFLFDRAQDLGDLDAARENLMHDHLTTTEMYARKRKAQVKSRIHTMSSQRIAILGHQDLNEKITRIESQLIELSSFIKEQNEK
jgi:site-specific recombinase XerC